MQNEVKINVNSRFENAKTYEANLERIAKERLEELNELARAEKISLEQLANLKKRLDSQTFNRELNDAKRLHALKMQNAKKEKDASVFNKDLFSSVKNSSAGKAVGSIAGQIPGAQYLANPVVGAIALGGAVIGGGATAGKSALKEYADYESAVNKTKALAGGSFNAESMTQRSMDVASKTIFNQTDIANAVNTLIQGGKTFEEALMMVETVAETAIAHGRTIEESASLLVSSSNQFGISAENVSHIADVFTKATVTTALSFQDLQDGMKNAGPALSSMGQSIERTTAILGVLGNIGISGAEAGTAVRSILAMSAGKQGEKTLEEYGVSMLGEDGKIRSIDLILADFANALEKSGLSQDKQLFEWKKIAGEYTGQAKEIARQTRAIEEQTRLLQESNNANKELAGTQMQGLNGLVNQIKSNWDILRNELGKWLAPIASGALEGIRDGITTAFSWLNEVFSSLALMFSPFLPAIKTMMKTLVEFFTGLFFGSITAILTAVTVLSVLFETANNFIKGIFNALKLLPVIGDKIADIIDNNPIAVIKREAERSAKLDKERADKLAKQEAEQPSQSPPPFSAFETYDEVEIENAPEIAETISEKEKEKAPFEALKEGNKKAWEEYNSSGAIELQDRIDELNKAVLSGKALGNNTEKAEKEKGDLERKLEEINKTFFDAETERALKFGESLTGVKVDDMKALLSGEYEVGTKWSGTTAGQNAFAQFDWEATGIEEKSLEQLKEIKKGISQTRSAILSANKIETIRI